jgi:Secretion system C-terminal sorting domain
MKIFTITLAIILTNFFYAFSQKQENLSYESGYTDDIFFNLEDSFAESVSNSNWDLAFALYGKGAAGSAILINDAKVTLYSVPNLRASEWDKVDTSGIDTWEILYNPNKSWTNGAFNIGRGGLSNWDMGWGELNVESGRFETEGDSLYVVKLSDGNYKKLRIDTLVQSVWTFTYSDIDGSNEVKTSIAKSEYPDKNFIYFSMLNNEIINREPENSTWDLLFTRYKTDIPGMGMFPTSGCLSDRNISIAKAENVDFDEIDDPNTEFSEETNAIGHGWKTRTGGEWIVFGDVYFIKKEDENIFKLAFETFEGSATGDFSFKYENIITSLGDENVSGNTILLYPNPAENNINLLLNNLPSGTIFVKIYSLGGQLAKEFTLNSNGNFEARNINISELNSGAYILQYQAGNIKSHVKLMIK